MDVRFSFQPATFLVEHRSTTSKKQAKARVKKKSYWLKSWKFQTPNFKSQVKCNERNSKFKTLAITANLR